MRGWLNPATKCCNDTDLVVLRSSNCAAGGLMSASDSGTVSPVPEHLRTVTPRLVVSDGGAAIAFYARAFGAEQIGDRFTGPDGELIHAEVRIGDSVVMITEDAVDGPVSSPERLGGRVTCVLSLYWADVDAAWERAVAAGAEVMYPLADQFYGERGGRLRDPSGQQWMMSQHIEDVPAEEMARRAAALFSGQ
jgi:PhnB protein